MSATSSVAQMTSIWSFACENLSYVGVAGIGLVTLKGALISVPSIAIHLWVEHNRSMFSSLLCEGPLADVADVQHLCRSQSSLASWQQRGAQVVLSEARARWSRLGASELAAFLEHMTSGRGRCHATVSERRASNCLL